MGRLVQVSDFSSVLQIAFGLNLLFTYFELRPFIKARWDAIDSRRKEVLKEVFFGSPRMETDPSLNWWSVLWPKIVDYVLWKLVIRLTAVASIASLGLLIWSSFDRTFSVRLWQMIGLLFSFFLTPPLYCVLAMRLLRKGEDLYRQAAHKLECLKAEESSASAPNENLHSPDARDGV